MAESENDSYGDDLLERASGDTYLVENTLSTTLEGAYQGSYTLGTPAAIYGTTRELPGTSHLEVPSNRTCFGSNDHPNYGPTQSDNVHGPVVHEGFIPRNTVDEEDDLEVEYPHPTAPRFMIRYDNGSIGHTIYPEPPAPPELSVSEDESSESDDEMILDDPAFLELIAGKDRIADSDYSMSDEEPSVSAEEMSVSDQDWEAKGEGRRGARRGRGRGRGRGRPRGSGRGGTTRGRRVPKGEGARGGKKGKRGPRAVAEPSQDFKRTLAEGTTAHLKGDYEAALQYALKAVQLNPEIFAAHSLLSEAYMAMGLKQESYVALWAGAHTKREPGLWWHVAERTLELEGVEREAQLRQVYECYGKIIQLDHDDYDARAERLKIQIELNWPGKAKNECEALLKLRPHNVEVLRDLAELCTSTKEPERALKAYEETIEFCTRESTPENTVLTWSVLNVYLDILDNLDRYDTAVFQLKRLSRWLLGRKEEVFWDAEEDDREWDTEDHPRRLGVKDFVPGRFPTSSYGDGLPLELRIKLGIFRLRLGHNHQREAMRHFDFLEPELTSPAAKVHDYDDLFRGVADAFREAGYHGDAVRFYEPIQQKPEATDAQYFYDLAVCYKALNRTTHAEICYKSILDLGGSKSLEARVQLARLYEDLGMNEQALRLVRELQKMGKRDLVARANLRTRPLTPPPRVEEPTVQTPKAKQKSSTVFIKPLKTPAKPKKPRTTYHEHAQSLYEAETTQGAREQYSTLEHLRNEVDAGNEGALAEWMSVANQMIADFRAMKVFFQKDKSIKFTGYNKRYRDARASNIAELNAMAHRLQMPDDADGAQNSIEPITDEPIPDDFRLVHFDEWLDVFCEYALNLAKCDDVDKCWEVLTAALDANVFYHHEDRFRRIHVTSLACALLLGDEERITNESRWFIRTFPHISDAYRLYSTVSRFYHGNRMWYNSGPAQKFLFRAVKLRDYAVLDQDGRNEFRFTQEEQLNWSNVLKKEGHPDGFEELDPTLLVLYGHILAMGRSHQGALNYYFRAFALRPDDPVLNLCIATSYIQHAFKRQSENRQFQIQQGLSFLFRYYDLRTKDSVAIHVQEAEFNVARAWHMLGLLHLALPAYETCIQLSERVRKEQNKNTFSGIDNDEDPEDFAKEAAFSVQSILAIGGDFESAKKATAQWLVL